MKTIGFPRKMSRIHDDNSSNINHELPKFPVHKDYIKDKIHIACFYSYGSYPTKYI